MMKGLFINTRNAMCSIYKSGLMLYNTISHTKDYDLSYIEIDKLDVSSLHMGTLVSDGNILPKYDFYIFNYHPVTMRDKEGVISRRFINLSGRKMCIILEMSENNPFAMAEIKGFDDYIVLDPTMNIQDSRFHAFPRPLATGRKVKHYETIPKIPIIGSFGFATNDKGFDLIVKAVSEEFDNAIVKINLSPSTYADAAYGESMRNKIMYECQRYVRDGIKLEFTKHFFNDDELIDWCEKNTVNCFFYNRNMPGLAAATDQAIMSGAPLSVSTNTTFRHIHQYLDPYPKMTIKESILKSHSSIQRMQDDWNSNKIISKLKAIL